MKYYIYLLPGTTRESPAYLVKITKVGAMFCSKKLAWHYNGKLAVAFYTQEDDNFV